MARPTTSLVQPPRRSAWTRLRAAFNLTPRTIDGWNDLTDHWEPPAGTLETFCGLHPGVNQDRVLLVWEAFLQWVRIRGRREGSLCQPSLAVDELWRQLKDSRFAVRTLPEQVLAMNRIPVRDHDSLNNLRTTLEEAHRDDGAARLPMIFLVDEAVCITDGRRYRADCVVEDCRVRSEQGDPPEPGRTCLHGFPWFSTLVHAQSS